MAFNLTANLNVAVNTGALKAAANQINSTLGSVNSLKIGTNSATFASLAPLKTQISEVTNSIENFGRQAGFAAKRFAAFAITAGSIITFTNNIREALSAAVDFDREMIRLRQVSGDTAQDVAAVGEQITGLSKNLGVSSKDLVGVAVVLKQANLTLAETKDALEAMAQAALAPNFDNLKDTTEGAIAIMKQFKVEAKDLGAALGSVNAVAGEFAVEASDIIEAIRKTGGAFKSAGGNLNELIALFTSVRQTTRESAESIGTGLRTIFTRIQRNDTANALKEIGINLRYTADEAKALGDVGLEQQFVGPYEAIKRLSSGLSELRSTDPRFSAIVEQLGGYRQISKVIPLIQEFATAQKALGVAQAGSVSLAVNAGQAQDALAVKLQKLKESFFEVGRSIVNSPGFRSLADTFIGAATSVLSLINSLKGLLPLFTALAAVKIGQGIGSFATGFVKGAGADNSSARTTATRRASGGFLRMQKGGIVPGSGSGDKVPALLEPGEMVIPKKYARGGSISVNKMPSLAIQRKLNDPNIPDDNYTTGKTINKKDKFKYKISTVFVDGGPKSLEGDFRQQGSSFEIIAADKLKADRIAKGKKGSNAPVDLDKNGFPYEVKNVKEPVDNAQIVDKLARYRLQKFKNDAFKNKPSEDSIDLGEIGLVYNSAKINANAANKKAFGKVKGITEEKEIGRKKRVAALTPENTISYKAFGGPIYRQRFMNGNKVGLDGKTFLERSWNPGVEVIKKELKLVGRTKIAKPPVDSDMWERSIGFPKEMNSEAYQNTPDFIKLAEQYVGTRKANQYKRVIEHRRNYDELIRKHNEEMELREQPREALPNEVIPKDNITSRTTQYSEAIKKHQSILYSPQNRRIQKQIDDLIPSIGQSIQGNALGNFSPSQNMARSFDNTRQVNKDGEVKIKSSKSTMRHELGGHGLQYAAKKPGSRLADSTFGAIDMSKYSTKGEGSGLETYLAEAQAQFVEGRNPKEKLKKFRDFSSSMSYAASYGSRFHRDVANSMLESSMVPTSNMLSGVDNDTTTSVIEKMVKDRYKPNSRTAKQKITGLKPVGPLGSVAFRFLGSSPQNQEDKAFLRNQKQGTLNRFNGGSIYRQRFMEGNEARSKPFPKGLYPEEILGFTKGYIPQGPELTSAFRRAALIHHSDRGGLPENMAQVNAAFQRLKDRSDLKKARSQSGPKTANSPTPPPKNNAQSEDQMFRSIFGDAPTKAEARSQWQGTNPETFTRPNRFDSFEAVRNASQFREKEEAAKTMNASSAYTDRQKAAKAKRKFAYGGDVVRQKFASGKFVAKDTKGNIVRDSVDAATEEEMRDKIRQMGYFVISLKMVDAKKASQQKLQERQDRRDQAKERAKELRRYWNMNETDTGDINTSRSPKRGQSLAIEESERQNLDARGILAGPAGAIAGGITGAVAGTIFGGIPGAFIGGTLGFGAGAVGGMMYEKSRKSEDEKNKGLARFSYQDEQGKKGSIPARDKDEAIRKLSFDGITPKNMRRVAPERSWGEYLEQKRNDIFGIKKASIEETNRESRSRERKFSKSIGKGDAPPIMVRKPSKKTKESKDIYKPLPALALDPTLGKSVAITKEMMEERKKDRGFASGGLVPGTGNSDTVPMDLDEGSFVIRKSSVNKIGADNLASAHKFASGGKVPALLTPGEYVYSPSEAKKIGANKLHEMNSFAKFKKGGEVGNSIVSDTFLNSPKNLKKILLTLVDQIMESDPNISKKDAKREATRIVSEIKVQNQTSNQAIGNVAKADQDISAEKSNIGVFNTELKGFGKTLSTLGKEATSLAEALQKNTDAADASYTAELALRAKGTAIVAARDAKKAAGQDLTKENIRVGSAQTKVNELKDKKKDMEEARQAKIDAADQKIAAAEQAKILKSQQKVDISKNVKRIDNITGSINVLRAQREQKLDRGQSTDAIDAKIEEQKRKRRVATKEMADKVAAGPDTKKEQAAIDRAKAQKAEAEKPLKSKVIDKQITKAEAALTTATNARNTKSTTPVDTSKEDAQILKLNQDYQKLLNDRNTNAQNRVAIENSITAVGTKQLNVQNEILKTEQSIKDAESNIQKAETAKAAAKASGEKATRSFQVNAKGEIVNEKGRPIGQTKPITTPDSIKEISKQREKEYAKQNGGKDPRKGEREDIRSGIVNEYRVATEKQLRAKAQKEGKPVSELQIQSMTDQYTKQFAQGKRGAVFNKQGEVIGDRSLGSKLIKGGDYKESGDLTFQGKVKDFGSRALFGSKRTDFEAGSEGERQFKQDRASGYANRITTAAVGGSLLASGMRAGAPEVSSLAKANEQGVVVEDKAQQEAYRSTLAFAGAIEKAGTYAATTATAFSALGPVGTLVGGALGGLVGLIKGYADGAKEAEAQIREVKLAAALTGLQGTFDKLNTGLRTFDDTIAESIAANQKIITEANAGKAFVEAGGEKNGFDRLISGITGGGFGGFDVKKFNELNSKSQKEAGAAQIVPLTNILNKQAEQLGSSAVKQAGGNAGTLDYKDFAASLDAKLTSGGGGFNNQQIQKIANARNVSFDDVKKEIVKVMKDSFKAAQLEKTQKEAVTANQRSINSMTLLSEAVVAAANSVESFSNKLSTNESLFSGGIGSTKVTGISNQFDQKSTPDFNAFNSSVSRLSDSLGSYGNEFKAQGNAINAASQALPSLLAGAVEDPVGGQDISVQIANGLREALSAQGIKGVGAEKVVSSVAGNVSGQEYTKLLAEAGGDVSKVAEKLLGNIKDPFLNAAKDISQKLENASNQYISGLENLAQRQKQIGESFKNLEGAKLQRDKFTAETVATNAGLPSQAGNLISVDRQMQGFRTNQERLTGTKGPEAQDSRVIGDNLKRTQERIRELEPKVQNASGAEGGGAAFRGAASELVKLKSEASNLQESLKNLADQSNNLAILEGKLGQVRQERDNETQRGREFLTADPKERQKILRDRVQGQGLLRQAQAQGGNVSNFSSEQNKALFAFLDSFGPVGKDIADNIVRNTTGLGKKKPEEDMLVGKLAKVYDEQVKANQELIGNQRSLQTDYFSQLTKQNTTFYSNLDKFIAGMEKSQVQDEKNREVAKSAKIKDVKEKSGFLREAGVTDENLKDVTANKGKISEVIKAREALGQEQDRSVNITKSMQEDDFSNSLRNSFGKSENTGENAAKEIASKGETLNDILSKIGLTGKQSTLVREKATTAVTEDKKLNIQDAIKRAIETVQIQTVDEAKKRVATAETGAGTLGINIANKAQEQGINAEKFESSLAAVTELNQGIGVKLTTAASTATANIDRLSASINSLGAQQQGIAPVNVNANPAQAIGFAVGGPAFSPRGSDTVPAMLTPGEFVVNRSATQRNLPLLQSINSGKTSYLADGGEVLGKRIKASEDVMKIWDTPGLKQEEKIASIRNIISNKYNSLKESSLTNVPNGIEGEPRKSAASAILQEVISSLSMGQIPKNESAKRVIDSNGGIEALQDFGNIFGDFKTKGEAETGFGNKKKEIEDKYNEYKKDMINQRLLDPEKSYDNFIKLNRVDRNFEDLKKYTPESIRKSLSGTTISAGKDATWVDYALVLGSGIAATAAAPVVLPALGVGTAAGTLATAFATSGVALAGASITSGNIKAYQALTEAEKDTRRMEAYTIDAGANFSGGFLYAGNTAGPIAKKVLEAKDQKTFSNETNQMLKAFEKVSQDGETAQFQMPGSIYGKNNVDMKALKDTYFYNGWMRSNGGIDIDKESPAWEGIKNYGTKSAIYADFYKLKNEPVYTPAQQIQKFLQAKDKGFASKYLIPPELTSYDQFIVNPEYLKSLNAAGTKDIDANIDAKIPQYIATIANLKAQKKDIVSEKKKDNVVANIANEEGTTPIDTQIRMAENEVLAARGNKELESKKKAELEILKLRRTSYNQIGLTSNEKLKNAYGQNRPEINENYVNSKAYLTQIKEGTGEKFVATDMGKEDELFLKRQGDAGRLAQIGLRREVQAGAILGKMVKLKGIFAKNQGEELNKKEFAEIGKDPNQLIPLGLKEYASLYEGQKGSLAKEDFDNPKLILPFQKEILSSYFKQQGSTRSLAISGKGLLDFIDQYSNIKDTKGFVEAKVKQAGPDAIPLVVRAIEEGKINALGVLNAAAANVGGISRKSLEGAIGRNADFNLLDKLSEKQEGKAQKIVRPFSGIDFIEGEDGAYATIKAVSGKGQVSMSANNTALRIAAPYLPKSIYNQDILAGQAYTDEGLKQLAGDRPTLGSPNSSFTFPADGPSLFTTEDFLNAVSNSQGYATISSKAVVVEEDVEGKKQRKIDYKRNLDVANIENSKTREAMKNRLKHINDVEGMNKQNQPEENKNVVKGEPNEFQAAIIKERNEQKELSLRLPRATQQQQLFEGQYGELSVESRLNRGEITREEAAAQIERERQTRKMSSGGVVNYLSSGGVPSHSPNPDPSFFKPKGTDTVPAMLTPGEFVINASATAKHGDLLSAINSGKDVGYSATGGLVYLEDGGQARKKAFYEKMNRQKKYEEESRYLVDDKNKDKYTYMQDRKDDLESTSNRATQTFSRRQNQFLQDEDSSNNDATNIIFDAMGITGLAKAGISAISKFAMKPSLETALHGAKHVGKDYLKEKAQHKGIDLLKSNTEKLLGYASGGLVSYLYNGGYSQRRANLAAYSGSENEYVIDQEEVGKQNTTDITNRIAAKNQAENNAFQMFSNTRFNDGTGSLFDNTQAGFSTGSGGVSAQQALSFQDPTKPGGEGVTSAAMGMLGDVQSRMRGGNNPFGNISATGAEVNALKTAKANEPEIQKQYDEYKKFIEEQKKQQEEEESGSTYASLGGLIYAVNGLTTLSPANPFATDEYLREKLKKEAEQKKQRELKDDWARQLRSQQARNAIEQQKMQVFRNNQNKPRQQQPEQWQINWQQQQQASGYKNPYAALQSKSMFPEQRQQQSENFQDQRAYQANQEMYGGPSAQPAFKASNYEGSFFNQATQEQRVQRDPNRKQLSLFGMNLGSYSTGGNVDTIPAMLTPGEFVVNKKASSKNSSLLHAINSGKEVIGYRTGGSVGNIRGKKVDPIESGINELTGKLSGVGNKFVQSGDSFKIGANANEKGAQNILASSSKFNSGVGSFADSANKISKRKGYNSGGMVNYFADGGFTPRGTDTVPAMLTPGEFVVNRQSTSKNLNLLKNINSNASYMSNGGLMYARRGRAVESQQQDSTSAIDMTSVTQLADAINKLGTTFLKPFGEQIDTFKAYAEALQTQVNKIPSVINIEVMGNLNASLNIDFNPEGVYTAVTQATEELKGWIVTQIDKQLKNEMNS